MAAPTRYCFGPFALEPDERRLLRDGTPVDLTPKALDVLTVLVERHGRLVLKEELLEAAWPDAVVEENALSVNVSRLRAALGETAHDWRYIETVPRSGYRFAAGVEVVPSVGKVEETTVTRRARTHVLIEETESWPVLPTLLVVAVAIAAVIAVVVGYPEGQRIRTVSGAPAASAATEIGATSLPDPSARALARAAYDRARAAWWKRRPVRGVQPAEEFRLALQHDSTFAPAYVGLAAVHAFAYNTASEVYPLLERAFALNPDLSGAYATRGFTRMMQEWNWTGAEADFRQALTLDPHDVSALQWLATLRMIQRRPREAEALLQRALAVAPAEARASLLADRAQALYYAGDYAGVLTACERVRVLDPGFPMGLPYLGLALVFLGRPNEAVTYGQALAPLPRYSAETRDSLAAAVSTGGTSALLRRLIALADPTPTLYAPLVLARLHALLGEEERALDYLDRAVAVREFHLPFVNADPAFDPIREAPRFDGLIRSLGLDAATLSARR